MTFKKAFCVFLLSFSLISCGNRTPSPQTAHTKIITHFQKYGKKYKNSDFGIHKIERVEIVGVREIQKNMAEADAYAHLSGGPTYKIRAIFRKKPFGWKVVSWENLGPA